MLSTGIDVDWEYPAQREGAVDADKDNFILLLAELRQALDLHQKLLSIAVGSSEKSASTSYNIPRMAALVDFVNLMSYDLHGSWDVKTGSANKSASDAIFFILKLTQE